MTRVRFCMSKYSRFHKWLPVTFDTSLLFVDALKVNRVVVSCLTLPKSFAARHLPIIYLYLYTKCLLSHSEAILN